MGYLVDRLPPTGIFKLMTLSSLLTLTTFWILRSDYLSTIIGPLFSLVPFSLGYGYVPM